MDDIILLQKYSSDGAESAFAEVVRR